MSSAKLLRLLQLASPTLPVGSYAYSQGIEAAVQSKLITDQFTAEVWLKTVLHNTMAQGDLALLYHFYQAWQFFDEDRLQRLNDLSAAIRETHELLQEDQHLAKALLRLAHSFDIPFPPSSTDSMAYPGIFARVAQHWEVDMTDALTVFSWSWVENQIAALVKLVPLGQTQGQLLMLSLDDTISQAVAKAQGVAEDDIGSSLPMLAIVSSQHETQYSRLFRS